MPKKTSAQKFAAIFRMFVGGTTPDERASAEGKMDGWLKRHGKTRADISKLLAQAEADDLTAQPPPSPSDPRDAGPPGAPPKFGPLAAIQACLEIYLALDPHEYVALALWVAHTWVYDRYMVTP